MKGSSGLAKASNRQLKGNFNGYMKYWTDFEGAYPPPLCYTLVVVGVVMLTPPPPPLTLKRDSFSV